MKKPNIDYKKNFELIQTWEHGTLYRNNFAVPKVYSADKIFYCADNNTLSTDIDEIVPESSHPIWKFNTRSSQTPSSQITRASPCQATF